MEPRCRVALLKSRQALIRDLDVEPAVDRLLSDLVITTADSCKIRAERLDHNKRRVLLDLLPGRGQKAFDVFLDHLSQGEYSQPWLRDTISESLATVTQEEIDRVQEEFQQMCRGGPTAQELQQALRCNIEKYIANDPSRILKEVETPDYVNQPIEAHKIEREGKHEGVPPKNIFELLETCSSRGQRVFVYGSAGMGKSSLCRHIAEIWAEGQSELSKQFDYVFPIPMRTVRSRSLLDIICTDISMIPEACKQSLEQEIELKSVPFILDSFEELSHETPEINRLIRRQLYPNSSVLVTARPGQKLEEEERESAPCIKASLQNLTEDQVRNYVRKYPCLNEDLQSGIEDRFGMRFLCRPINLWLLCLLVARISTSAGIPETQTVMLNMIIQHLVLAYSRKKKLPEFALFGEESPLKNAPTEVKLLLEKAGQLCYYSLREKSRTLSLEDGLLSKADLIALGLFSEGPDDKSVTLPHPLFQEYLAALFLSIDKRAREEFFKELEGVAEHSTPKLSLIELLRPRGVDNISRFLFGLLPGVTDRLSGLLAKCSLRPGRWYDPLDGISYELSLLAECRDEASRSLIADALLNVPLAKNHSYSFGDWESDITDIDSGIQFLLCHYDREQAQAFLRRFYKCQICNHELIRVETGWCFSSINLDRFVLAMICLHNCTIGLHNVTFRYCRIPVSVLTNRLGSVSTLTLDGCTLCALTESQFLASLKLSASSNSSTPVEHKQSQLSLTDIDLVRTRGLNFLSPPYVVLPTTLGLSVSFCGDINLGSLSQCFPGVSDLRFFENKRFYADKGSQWPSVDELAISWIELISGLKSLKEVFFQLENLELDCDVPELYNTIDKIDPLPDTTWHTVTFIDLYISDDFIPRDQVKRCEEKVRAFLTHLCPQAEIVTGDAESIFLRRVFKMHL